MEIREIYEELIKWQAENKDNRAVILIACTKSSEEEGSDTYSTTAAACGRMEPAVKGVRAALQKGDIVGTIIKRGFVEYSLKSALGEE